MFRRWVRYSLSQLIHVSSICRRAPGDLGIALSPTHNEESPVNVIVATI